MKKIILIAIFYPIFMHSQLNCNSFDSENCKKACEMVNFAEPYQGYKESQELFDKAIELCPNFDYAYREKSVPYLKRGDFITWKVLIDKAVEINPKDNLGYRGWCKYQFLRDYKAAITDIESLEKLIGEDNTGYSQNGNYSLQIVKALCYKGLGNKSKAIEIMENQFMKKDYRSMPFDYYHIGVLYFEQNNLVKAKEYFENQIANNDYYAEPYYYLSLIFYHEKNIAKAKEFIRKAIDYYYVNKFMKDSYTTIFDKVYEKDMKNFQKNFEN